MEPVDPRLIAELGLPPVSLSHYPAEAAYRQKLGALASRARTQARDVFDLDHLLRSGVAPAAAAAMPELELPAAFSSARARRLVSRIPSPRRRAMVARRLDLVLAA